ncbi:pseudouridylate synthase RPUSD2-like [Culicoides brevitarsis]|uniref:pseudouridylate synthase RPUSD2-like n=1 Tax=Culicoides brevitarsis TaxID=469753 RepID=UPI00307C7701
MHFRTLLTHNRIAIAEKILKISRKMCDNAKPVLKEDQKLVRSAQTQHGTKENAESILVFKENHVAEKVSDTSGAWNEDFHVIESSQMQKFDKNPEEPEQKRKPSTTNDPRPPKKKRVKADFMNRDRPGYTEDRFDETSYYFENGLRKVYPYFFTFTTFTKGRWVGENIMDVFTREFRAYPIEKYNKTIQDGKLTVNDKKVTEDYILQHNDFLSNTVHRHELPVVAQKIEIVHLDDDVCIIDKPASIPVHPCGRYRHNTVVFILAKEYNFKNLKPIHRLDRLTSGLLMLGRNVNRAREMQRHIDQREVQKEYVCCVEGEFPSTPITCAEPIEPMSHKIGISRVSKSGSDKGKECQTFFELLRYDSKSNTSIVICKPRTGRMHQIRVHLQYLGFPIVNDPLYNHTVFGPTKGKDGDFGGQTDDELIARLIEIHNAENFLGIEGDEDLAKLKIEAENVEKSKNPNDKSCQTGYEAPDSTFDPAKMTSDENCLECKMVFKDPNPEQLVMYLHALKYTGPDWHYETKLPYWAQEGFEYPLKKVQ